MEEGEEVKLLGGLFSPFVHRVKWVLKLKGIECEYIYQDSLNKSPLLLSSNPVHKKIPVLIHNDKPVCESLVIIEYLDETWKNNPLFPQDSYERAMARFWAKFIDEKLCEVMRKLILLDGEKQEKEVENAKEALEILEGELKGGNIKLFGGENTTIGILDIVLGFMALCLGVFEEVACVKVFDSLKYPNLNKWMEDFLELPIIKESLSEIENLATYFHKIRQLGLAKYGLALAKGK